MKYLYSALLLICTLFQLLAQPHAVVHKVDSLNKLLPSLHGNDRLDAYLKMTQVAVMSDFVYELSIADRFVAEAKAQGNMQWLEKALYKRICCYFNHSDQGNYIEEADRAMAECQKLGLENLYYRIFSDKVTILIAETNIYTVREQISKSYDRVKKSGNRFGQAMLSAGLARVFQICGDICSSEKYLCESANLLKKQGPDTYNDLMDVYFNLSSVYREQKKYEQALRCTDDFLSLLSKIESGKNTSVNIDCRYALCYFCRGIVYFDMADADALHACYLKMKEHNGQIMHKLFDELAMSDAILQGRYNEALQINSEIIEMYDSYGDNLSKLISFDARSRIFHSMGNDAEAYNMLRCYSDSLELYNSMETQGQMAAIATYYELDKKEVEAKNMRLGLVLVSIVVLLLMALATAYIVYSRKLKKRNIVLCSQIEELSRIDRERVQVKQKTIDENIAKGNEISMFDRIEKVVRSERLYADSNFNRDKLAERLNVNYRYITDGIKQCTGLTFADYVCNIRLVESVRLMETEGSLSLAAIAEEAGFASYTTFYRAFLKNYGITPADYEKFRKEANG